MDHPQRSSKVWKSWEIQNALVKGHSNKGLNLKQLHKNLGHFFVEWWCHQITILLRPMSGH